MKSHDHAPIQLEFIDEGCQRKLIAEQWVSTSLEKVFTFFSQPANLEILTPRNQKLRMVSPSPPPAEMSEGMTMTYRLRVAGIPLSWTARIENITAPDSFTDVMVKGPYRAWRHTHSFHPKDGGTLIRDEITYKSYTCRYGHRWFIRPQLEKIFHARGKIVAELFQEESQPDRPES